MLERILDRLIPVYGGFLACCMFLILVIPGALFGIPKLLTIGLTCVIGIPILYDYIREFVLREDADAV